MKFKYPDQLETTTALRQQLRFAGINGRLARPNFSLRSLPQPGLRTAPTFLWDPLRLDRLKAPLTRYHD